LIIILSKASLNTDDCVSVRDLFDSNKNFIQSACLVTKELTYNRAEMYCKANGMGLFDISSEESKTALFQYATEIFGEGSGSALFVKGRLSGECQYIDNAGGSFETRYRNCYDAFYSFCGFQNPEPVEPGKTAKCEFCV
jgi:hypothetical protein